MNNRDEQKNASPAVGWLRSWWYLFCLIIIIAGICSFYLEENWRGDRSLNGYKRKLAARGEPLERSAFVPPPVPDSQNFANAPLLAPLFDFFPGTQNFASTNALANTQSIAPVFDSAKLKIKENKNEIRSNSWIKAHVDLAAWSEAFRAALEQTNNARKPAENKITLADKVNAQEITNYASANPKLERDDPAKAILEALSECDLPLQEIREYSQKPFSRFNIKYQEKNPAAILLPHLVVLKHFTEILQLRVAAELAVGRTNDAFNDLRLMLYLAKATRDEPIFISQMVRIAQMQLALPAIDNGMREWSLPQLQEIERLLTDFNFCGDIKRAIQAERALFGAGVIDFVRSSPKEFNSLLSMTSNSEQLPEFLLAGMPRGWFDLETVNYYRLIDGYLAPDAFNVHHVNPARVHQAQLKVELKTGHSSGGLIWRHCLFARLLMPNIEGAIRKAAYAQQGVEAAMIACALERYRRSHQNYPDRLDLLVPDFIPNLSTDIISGKPLHYKQAGNGHYLLYSVGWNEADDGGKVVWGNPNSPGRTEGGVVPLEGDWVWAE